MSCARASAHKVAALKTAELSHKASVALMKWLSAQTKRMGIAEHVYVVGGSVRNFILDQPIKDIDMVVDSLALGRGKDAEWLAQQLSRQIPAQTDIITSSLLVSTVQIKGSWVLDGYEMNDGDIDIADARAEEYEVDPATGDYVGHKPIKVSPTTMEDDVSRREFTFNTLLWRLMDLSQGPDKAEIIDLTGCGLRDLENREMRCPGDPDDIFAKDPTRILRTIKFAFKYGMKLPPDVKAAAKRQAKGLKRVPSKVWQSLEKIVLGNPQYKKALEVMDDLGVLDVLAEMMEDNQSFRAAMNNYAKGRGVAYMFSLMDKGLPVGSVMGFLDGGQQKRLREITLPMDSDEALVFLDLLKSPGRLYDKKFAPGLARQNGVDPKDYRHFMPQITEIGRQALLDDPELTRRPEDLKRLISDRVGRGRMASRVVAAGAKHARLQRIQMKRESAATLRFAWQVKRG